MKKLVIDTDIGTDVDDLFALAYILKNPNPDIKISAITTVQEHVQVRAKIVRKLEKILGVNIPIFSGTEPLTEGHVNKEGKTIKYYAGFEHLSLTPEELNETLQNQNQEFPEYDNDTELVCIGPLTNIALQLEKNPSIKNVERVYFMGSDIADSHNFACDAKAAEKVLGQPWEKVFITKEVSKKICLSREEFKQLRGNELGEFAYESAIRWLNHSGRKETPMYDVLAVSAAMGEYFVKFESTNDGTGSLISYDVDLRLKEKILEAVEK